ncbi:MAG: hypothetical protein LAO55_19905 [Acidobacteriia bacterium]|nr:hypothetical protein [Terriglobia bacterium]
MAIFDRPSRDPLPEPDFEDVKYATGKGIVSLIPGLGEAWGLIIATPLEHRRNDWLRDLESRLRELEEYVKGFRFDNLGQNQEFVSATLQATQAALQTHLKDKREALRNAVLNVALGKEPDPNRQQQFLVLLDRFSEDHLKVLSFLGDPAGHFQKQGEQGPHTTYVAPKMLVNDLVARGLPHLRRTSPGDQTSTSFQYIEMILGELVSLRLVSLERLQETWAIPAFAIKPVGGPVGKMTTHLGEEFLAFITEPDLGK